VGGESPTYPDAAVTADASADGAVLAFLSASTAFVAARTDEPQPSHLFRAVPAEVAAPSWPDGAKLSAVPGTTTITVSWPAASSTAKTYEVSVNGTKASTVETTQAVLTNLTPGTTVQVSVVAKDADGRASAALTASVTLLSDLPTGDAPLSAIAGPGAVVHLRWDASSLTGLTGYRVMRDGKAIADTTTTGYDDPNVAADTAYTYAVFALRGTEQIRLTRDAAARTPAMSVSDAT